MGLLTWEPWNGFHTLLPPTRHLLPAGFPLRGLRDLHLPHHTRSLRSRPRARPRAMVRRRPGRAQSARGGQGGGPSRSPRRGQSRRAPHAFVGEPWEGSRTLPRWCAAGQGAREARGVGRVAGRPEVPAGGKAGGLPTRLSGNPGRVPRPSRDGAPPAKPAGSPRD